MRLDQTFREWNYLLYNYLIVDCATISNGEMGFCHCNTCAEDEGDCHSHDECQEDIFCGSNNCPNSIENVSEVDCCYR